MSAYLIDLKSLKIVGSFETVELADAAGWSDTKLDYHVAASEGDLISFTNSELTSMYNHYRPSDKVELKKFDTVSAGVKRVWDIIVHLPKEDLTMATKKAATKNAAPKNAAPKKAATKKAATKKAPVPAKVAVKDGKVTVTSLFREAIVVKKLNRDDALTYVRERVPKGRHVPSNYYAWYTNKFSK